jgi:hypothetical protein
MDSIEEFDNLCSECRALFDQEALQILQGTWNCLPEQPEKKHLNLKSLEVSGKRGCHLCNLIMNALRRTGSTVENSDMDLQTVNPEEIQLSISFGHIAYTSKGIWISGIDHKYTKVLYGSLLISAVVRTFTLR